MSENNIRQNQPDDGEEMEFQQTEISYPISEAPPSTPEDPSGIDTSVWPEFSLTLQGPPPTDEETARN